MSEIVLTRTVPVARPILAALCLGCLATAVDLAAALAYWRPLGLSAEQLMQGVASWFIGRPWALAAGPLAPLVATLGLIATMTVMVAGFDRIARHWPNLARHPIAAGAAYGALMYGLMFSVLVPLSTGNPARIGPVSWELCCLAVYVTALGIPSALLSALRRRDRA